MAVPLSSILNRVRASVKLLPPVPVPTSGEDRFHAARDPTHRHNRSSLNGFAAESLTDERVLAFADGAADEIFTV